MADKDKHETHEAPAKKEAAPPPKPSKEEMLAELLRLYSHGMESASPRTREELVLIQELVAAK